MTIIQKFRVNPIIFSFIHSYYSTAIPAID